MDPIAPAFLAAELSAVFVVLIMLNARDRRRARALGIVLSACAAPLRRGWLSVHVRAPAWSRYTIAVVDMSGGDIDAVWSIVRRLAVVLPADIRLVVAMPREGAAGTTIARLRSLDATEATQLPTRIL